MRSVLLELALENSEQIDIVVFRTSDVDGAELRRFAKGAEPTGRGGSSGFAGGTASPSEGTGLAASPVRRNGWN
jgi:hypothetical protein